MFCYPHISAWMVRWYLADIFDTLTVWPFRALRRVSRESSSMAIEFCSGLGAVLFAITLLFGHGARVMQVVLSKILSIEFWCAALFILGTMQMWFCTRGSPSARAQTSAIAALLWGGMGLLLLIHFGLTIVHGLIAGFAFMCALAVLMLIESHHHGPTG
jgi:hypothetical protein